MRRRKERSPSRYHHDRRDITEYGLTREAEDVAAVVESAGEPAVLIGHSYGALCSLEGALRTDELRGLVLYEPVFPVGDGELYTEELLAEMATLHRDGENERLLVLLLEDIVGLSPADVEAFRSEPSWSALVDGTETLYRETRAETEYEFDPSRFGELTVPTLLVTGSESPQRLAAPTREIDDALPNSHVATLEGHGHDGIHTAPERFTDEVLPFVRAPG